MKWKREKCVYYPSFPVRKSKGRRPASLQEEFAGSVSTGCLRGGQIFLLVRDPGQPFTCLASPGSSKSGPRHAGPGSVHPFPLHETQIRKLWLEGFPGHRSQVTCPAEGLSVGHQHAAAGRRPVLLHLWMPGSCPPLLSPLQGHLPSSMTI